MLEKVGSHPHAATGARDRADARPRPAASRPRRPRRDRRRASPIPATSARSAQRRRQPARRQSSSGRDRSTPTIPRSCGPRPARSSGSRWWTRSRKGGLRWRRSTRSASSVGTRLGAAAARRHAATPTVDFTAPDRGRARQRGPRPRRRVDARLDGHVTHPDGRARPSRSTWRWPAPSCASRPRASGAADRDATEVADAVSALLPDGYARRRRRRDRAPPPTRDELDARPSGSSPGTRLRGHRELKRPIKDRSTPPTEPVAGKAGRRRPRRAHRRAGRGPPRASSRRGGGAGGDRDRLDLTLGGHGRQRGHLHLVTQVQRELEDIFVGMGYRVVAGSRGRGRLAQLRGAQHAARPSRPLDAGHALRRARRARAGDAAHAHVAGADPHMETQKPPIFVVAPGRTYRNETLDARHSPVFHQIEALAVDRGITLADLVRHHRDVRAPPLRRRADPHPLPSRLLPVHRAVGRAGGELHLLRRRRVPRVLAVGVDRARWLRDGRPQRAARRRHRPRGVHRASRSASASSASR